MLKGGSLIRLTKLIKLLTDSDSEKNRQSMYNTRNENEAITRGYPTLKNKGYYEHNYAHNLEKKHNVK